MHSRVNHAAAISMAAMSMTLLSQPVFAQAAPSGSTNTRNTSELEDIVVTARKIGEASQSLPITVQAFSGEELSDKVVLSVQDLQGITPGLTISNNPTGGVPIFAIRGTATELGIEGGVALYFNDVPLISTIGIMNAFYDVSTVEVLKGPQGTQFGTNTTGGTISVRTNLPTDKLEGYAKVGYGNFDRREFEGMINLPVNDVLGFRFAGNYVKRDGYVQNPDHAGELPKRYQDENHYSGRGTMSLKSGPVENYLILDYYNRDEKPFGLIPVRLAPSLLGIDLTTFGAQLGDHNTIHQGPDATGVPRNLYGKAHLYGIQDRLNVEINDNFSLRNVLGYRRDHTGTHEEDSGTNTVTVDVIKDTQASQWSNDFTLRFEDDANRVRASLGGYYSFLRQDIGINANVLQGLFAPFDVFFPGIANNVISTNNFEERENQSKAVYFNTDFDVTDTFGVQGGFRYNWDNVNSQVTAGSALGASPLGTLPIYNDRFRPYPEKPCAPSNFAGYDNFNSETCSASRDKSFKAPSWLFGVTNKFSDRVLTYAKISHGYLSGGANFTLRDTGRTFFDPEKNTMIEVGVKADWSLADRPIRTNLSIYRGKINDKQVFANANYTGGGTGFGVVNAAKETVYGADLELRYSPFDGMTLDASYNYIHAKFDEFIYPALGSGPGAVPAVDLSGATPSQTPEHQVNVAATYVWPLAEATGYVSTTLSGYYTSKITQSNRLGAFDDAVGGDLNNLPDYFLMNASLDWENVMSSPVSVQLWARNVFDKQYITATNIQFATFGWGTAIYGAPRTYGISASVKF